MIALRQSLSASLVAQIFIWIPGLRLPVLCDCAFDGKHSTRHNKSAVCM